PETAAAPGARDKCANTPQRHRSAVSETARSTKTPPIAGLCNHPQEFSRRRAGHFEPRHQFVGERGRILARKGDEDLEILSCASVGHIEVAILGMCSHESPKHGPRLVQEAFQTPRLKLDRQRSQCRPRMGLSVARTIRRWC